MPTEFSVSTAMVLANRWPSACWERPQPGGSTGATCVPTLLSRAELKPGPWITFGQRTGHERGCVNWQRLYANCNGVSATSAVRNPKIPDWVSLSVILVYGGIGRLKP